MEQNRAGGEAVQPWYLKDLKSGYVVAVSRTPKPRKSMATARTTGSQTLAMLLAIMPRIG